MSKRNHEELLRVMFPDHFEFVSANAKDYKVLDRKAIQHYSQELDSLGFIPTIDYSVRFPGLYDAVAASSPYARLFAHPEHRCFAEVNQFFSENGNPIPVGCLLASFFEDGWDLTTTDRKCEPFSYVWRRARRVWSRHSEMTPAGLLAEHLRRRQRMIAALGLVLTTDLTPEAYFAQSRINAAEQKEALRSKSMETILAEVTEVERNPILEWSGNLPAGCWEPNSTHQ